MTTAFACPETIIVLIKTILILSPRGVDLPRIFRFFSTGNDSPVKEDSCVLKSFISIKRASAGTLSPSSNNKISPGTSWLEGSFITSLFL